MYQLEKIPYQKMDDTDHVLLILVILGYLYTKKKKK